MTVIVTRHPALIDFLREEGIISAEAEVIAHASPEAVQGKEVIGVLPMRLAALTKRFTEVSMTLRPDQRGRELTLEEIRAANPVLTTYEVRKVA